MEWSPPRRERNLSRFERLNHQFSLSGTGLGYLVQILGVRVAFRFGFQHGDRNIAAVLDIVAQCFELGLQPGNPHRRRAHVDTATRLAEIERHSDDADVFGFDVLQRFGNWTGRHKRFLN